MSDSYGFTNNICPNLKENLHPLNSWIQKFYVNVFFSPYFFFFYTLIWLLRLLINLLLVK